MLNLSQQIAPSLAARQPSPDQTFGAYVRELLATSKGFGGPFAGAQNQQTQPTPQTKIVDGLFGKFLPETSGGDSYGNGDGSGGSPAQTGPAFGSAESVIALDKAAAALQSPIGRAVGMFTGLPVNTLGLGASLLGNAAWNTYNTNFDRSMDAFDTAATLGGVGTVSDKDGNVSSFTNQDMIDAYDRATFGVTGAELGSAGGDPYGGASVDNMGAGGYVDAAMGGGYDSGGSGGDSTSSDGPSNDGGHNSSGD